MRPDGNVIGPGKHDVNNEVEFRWRALMPEMCIWRTSSGEALQRHDFPCAASLYLDGWMDIDGLIACRTSPAEINFGFHTLHDGSGGEP